MRKYKVKYKIYRPILSLSWLSVVGYSTASHRNPQPSSRKWWEDETTCLEKNGVNNNKGLNGVMKKWGNKKITFKRVGEILKCVGETQISGWNTNQWMYMKGEILKMCGWNTNKWVKHKSVGETQISRWNTNKCI